MVSTELLRRYPFFGGLTDAELAGIAMVAQEITFASDVIIFEAGDLATQLYVLETGAIELLHRAPGQGGDSITPVGSIAAGEPFGVSAFLEPYRMTATARCQAPVKAVAIDAFALRAMSEVDCHLGYTVMAHIARALAERLSYARVQLAACRPA